MSAQEHHKSAGLGLCVLFVLATIAMVAKIGIDLDSMEFSMGPRSAGASGLPTGEPAPEFSLEDLEGNAVSLADQQGQVVLVDFWATWCGPCIEEMPHIQQLHEHYKDQGLVVLAISTDDQKSAVQPFIEKKGYTFPVLFADGEVQPAYQISGIPSVYLIDRAGEIRFHQVGYSPGSEKNLERQVEELLAEEAI